MCHFIRSFLRYNGEKFANTVVEHISDCCRMVNGIQLSLKSFSMRLNEYSYKIIQRISEYIIMNMNSEFFQRNLIIPIFIKKKWQI